MGCRQDNANEWTERQIHEARMHRENRFLTLTYDNEHLPTELRPKHLTDFIKRLREHRSRDTENIFLGTRSASIRYLACGEYGDKTERPHYHLSLFNCGFADEIRYSNELRESQTLTAIWGKGAAKLATFTPRTAGYVANYLVKEGKKTYYMADHDGVIHEREPPFRRMSKNPAIGRTWLEKYGNDLQHGYIIKPGGMKVRIPRYYTKWLLSQNAHKQKTEDRRATPIEHNDSRTPDRLRDAEIIHKANQKRKSREL